MARAKVEHLPPSIRHPADLYLVVGIERAADMARADFLASLDSALTEARRASIAEYDETQIRRGTLTPGLVS